MNVLHREFGLTELKLAQADAGGDMTFTGYGAVFNNIDAYGDLIAPGAFAKTLSDAKSGGTWPAMLLQHGGWGMSSEDLTPIGVWTDFAEDGHGLKISGKLADTPRGREAYALLKMTPRPAIDGLSIGFVPKEWEPRSKPEDPRRTLKRVDLIEVSLVTFPANPKARVESVKSTEQIESLSDAETFLRDACGFSRKEAAALVGRIKSLGQRDAVSEVAGVAAALSRNAQNLRRKSP